MRDRELYLIRLPELAANPFARGAEERRGRSLLMLRTIMGMLAQDRGGGERLALLPRHPRRGFLFDLMNQVASEPSPDVFRWMLPAGQRREVQRLDARILEMLERLSPVAGRILLGAVGRTSGLGGFHLGSKPGRRALPADPEDAPQAPLYNRSRGDISALRPAFPLHR
jgi:hypothetical protein